MSTTCPRIIFFRNEPARVDQALDQVRKARVNAFVASKKHTISVARNDFGAIVVGRPPNRESTQLDVAGRRFRRFQDELDLFPLPDLGTELDEGTTLTEVDNESIAPIAAGTNADRKVRPGSKSRKSPV
jgi:hypothetical protein